MTIEITRPPKRFNSETAKNTSYNIAILFFEWLINTGYIWWIWIAKFDPLYKKRLVTEFSYWFANHAEIAFNEKQKQRRREL